MLKDYPQSSRVTVTRTELAELLYVNERYEEAAALLEKVSADKNAPQATWMVAQYRLGWCYSKLGKTGDAAKVFAEAASRYPNHDLAASSLYQAGLAFSETGDTKQAEAMYTQLRSEHAESDLGSIALLKLGEYAASREDYDASKKYYTQYLEGKPDERFVYLAQFGLGWGGREHRQVRRGAAVVRQGDRSEEQPDGRAGAVPDRRDVLRRERTSRKPHANCSRSTSSHDYPEWSGLALYEAGRAFEQLGDKAKAAAQYRRVVDVYGNQPIAADAKKRLAAVGN